LAYFTPLPPLLPYTTLFRSTSAYTPPQITNAPPIWLSPSAFFAVRFCVSSLFHSATMTFVSIAVVIPRPIPAIPAATSVCPFSPFQSRVCRFPCTSQRHFLSAPPSPACLFHLPQPLI